jgi:methyl-accepting chemotaxis protein
VDQTGANITSAVEFVNRSGVALSEIVKESGTSADRVQGIATAAEEQSVTSAEISRSLADINESAEASTELMRTSMNAVGDVRDQVRELQKLVARLRETKEQSKSNNTL